MLEAISTQVKAESRPGRLSQPSLSNLRESCKGRRYLKVADNTINLFQTLSKYLACYDTVNK